MVDLEKQGLHHNDLRTWNIIYDGNKAYLIDYGVVSNKITDGSDACSLLWVVAAVLSGKREGYNTNKTELPPVELFKDTPKLLKLYKAIEKGLHSPRKLQELFTK